MFEGKKQEREREGEEGCPAGHDQRSTTRYIAYERCSLTYNPYQLTTAGSCHQICPRRLTQLQTPQKRGHAAFCLSRTNGRGSTAANWPVPIQPLGGLSHAKSSLGRRIEDFEGRYAMLRVSACAHVCRSRTQLPIVSYLQRNNMGDINMP